MDYAIGAIAGLVFGGVIGQLKNSFIWQKYIRESASDKAGPNEVGGLYTRLFISYAINILTLAIAFFARNVVPFNGIAFLIGTAIALASMNKVLALSHKKQVEKREEA